MLSKCLRIVVLTLCLSAPAFADSIIQEPLSDPGSIGSILASQIFFDEAAFGVFNLPGGPQFFDGWVSQFGALNGGQFFWTDLFDSSPTSVAQVWWNFTGSKFWLTMIDVYGTNSSGGYVEELYSVPSDLRFISDDQTVTVPNGFQIRGISFYGMDPQPVPETNTITLLFVAGFFSFIFRIVHQRTWQLRRKL